MQPIHLRNYAEGQWVAPKAGRTEARSALNGEVVANLSSEGLDFAAMLDFARAKGGAALRRLSFHQRAAMLKALAEALTARKDELYELSYETGATKADSAIDIDGGTRARPAANCRTIAC
jgi:oxepin-CoA hydrolase / 3-oxo-5,6-dehydrosuberyl-CoA semialdehyde dehydrogenase